MDQIQNKEVRFFVKKAVFLALVFLNLCMLYGCRGQTELPLESKEPSERETVSILPSTSSEATTPFITSTSEEPTTEEIGTTTAPMETASLDLVEDAYYETSEFMGISLSYRIPRVLIEGEEIERANDELYDAAFSKIKNAFESVENGSEPYILSSSYEWAVNGDTLSLHYLEKEIYDDYIDHVVYNYSISHGTVLSKEELLQSVGWTISDFEEKCRQVLVTELINWPFPKEPGDKLVIDWQWFDAYSETLTDENIADAVPFLNEKGHLCMIGYGYTLYAGGYDAFVFDLEEYEVSPYYSADYQIGDVIVFE